MAYKATQDPRTDIRERLYLPELLRGLAITTRHFFRNLFGRATPTPRCVDRKGTSLVTTVQYPEEKIAYPRATAACTGWCRARTASRAAWPATCARPSARRSASTSRRASTSRADAAAESRVIEKFPTAFVIDELRCIVCGLCVDACPKDAIRMDTYTHTPPEYNRAGLRLRHPQAAQGARRSSHPSDPWNKRDGSEAAASTCTRRRTPASARAWCSSRRRTARAARRPRRGHASAAGAGRTVVTQQGPIQVTKFLK